MKQVVLLLFFLIAGLHLSAQDSLNNIYSSSAGYFKFTRYNKKAITGPSFATSYQKQIFKNVYLGPEFICGFYTKPVPNTLTESSFFYSFLNLNVFFRPIHYKRHHLFLGGGMGINMVHDTYPTELITTITDTIYHGNDFNTNHRKVYEMATVTSFYYHYNVSLKYVCFINEKWFLGLKAAYYKISSAEKNYSFLITTGVGF